MNNVKCRLHLLIAQTCLLGIDAYRLTTGRYVEGNVSDRLYMNIKFLVDNRLTPVHTHIYEQCRGMYEQFK